MAGKRGTGRDRIVEAAWELWNSKGPHNTTIAEICAVAGVAQATFFYHFDSVPQVIAERVKVSSEIGALPRRLLIEDPPTTVAIEALVALVLPEVMTLGAPIVSELIATMIAKPEMFRSFNDENLAVRSTFALVYERAQSRGELAPGVDPETMATCALSLAVLALVEWAHGTLAEADVRHEILTRLGLLHSATLLER